MYDIRLLFFLLTYDEIWRSENNNASALTVARGGPSVFVGRDLFGRNWGPALQLCAILAEGSRLVKYVFSVFDTALIRGDNRDNAEHGNHSAEYAREDS
jgi:hypothetical protein